MLKKTFLYFSFLITLIKYLKISNIFFKSSNCYSNYENKKLFFFQTFHFYNIIRVLFYSKYWSIMRSSLSFRFLKRKYLSPIYVS